MSAPLDSFFEHYYRRRPVNATFTGLHAYDGLLPDWSLAGLVALDEEMSLLHDALSSAYGHGASAREMRDDPARLDADLAQAFLEIQRAENAGAHGPRGNPSLWTGEAIFSVVSLMIRDFAPLEQRCRSAVERCEGIPVFLEQARATIGARPIHALWAAKALRECEGAAILFGAGIDCWVASGALAPALAAQLRAAASRAATGFVAFAGWLQAQPAAPDGALACGPPLYDLLLSRGHQCTLPREELLRTARVEFLAATTRHNEMALHAAGSWSAVREQLAADHPTPESYLDAFTRVWDACRTFTLAHDVVRWPDWPIRYVRLPEWTRDSAPSLYYLYYRSPAPLDPYGVHEYVVPPLPASPADIERHLRAWNHSTITLNHVVHHGAIGHHVQNWHAYHRAQSRIGKVAAVDCANRIGMFAGGTMAEGWACYATEVMDELGFLTPLHRVAEQHSRLRFIARAIVDIELHQGSMSVSEAIHFYTADVGMDAATASAEVVKCSMFPCSAIIYWLGTRTIRALRERRQRLHGDAFSLAQFHDELLGFGSIPLPLIDRLMSQSAA